MFQMAEPLLQAGKFFPIILCANLISFNQQTSMCFIATFPGNVSKTLNRYIKCSNVATKMCRCDTENEISYRRCVDVIPEMCA